MLTLEKKAKTEELSNLKRTEQMKYKEGNKFKSMTTLYQYKSWFFQRKKKTKHWQD